MVMEIAELNQLELILKATNEDGDTPLHMAKGKINLWIVKNQNLILLQDC